MSEKKKVLSRLPVERDLTGSGTGVGAEKKNPKNEHLLEEHVNLNNEEADKETPGQGNKPHSQVGTQNLLPHERDQTTRSQGTGQDNEDESSRGKIEQAAEDTRRGLKDTDRRGIPSEIITDNDTPNEAAKARKKRR